MNNLKLYTESSLNLELQTDEEVVQFSAFDIERNRLFFLSSANFVYTTQLTSFHNERMKSVAMLPAEVHHIDVETGDCVTSFDYLMEKEALIVGTRSGLLLLFSVDGSGSEVVGRVEGGVKRISPSPDGDLLCIISGLRQILVMTHDWDLMYENTLEDFPEGEPNFSEQNDFESSISWRGDGKYFATLSDVENSNTSLKKLKIWERDGGSLHASSEFKNFVEGVLDWMPSGAKIAAVYDKKSEIECPTVVFFERNGLERSSFHINEKNSAKVELLKWNCSSDLLAAIVRCENYDSVKVWFFSNNHWYLKHEIRYSKQDMVSFVWDPTRPLQLFCWTVHGQITMYNFIWISAIMENSTALVIDDAKILVTPLSLSLMPPPLYLFSLKFSSAVRDVAFYSKNSKSCLAAFLSDGRLCTVEFPGADFWEELEGKEFYVEASSFESTFGSFQQFVWLDVHKLLVVSHYGSDDYNYVSQGSPNEEPLGFCLLEIDLECSKDHVPGLPTCSAWHARISNRKFIEGPVICVASNPAENCTAFLQLNGGEILKYASGSGFSREFLKQEDKSFSSSCPWMSVALVDNNGLLKPLLFGLDDVGRVHLNRMVVCNNCSGFSFYSNLGDQITTHLILGTKQDMLCILDILDVLHKKIDEEYNFFQASNKCKEEGRNFIYIWERSAKIVGVLHGDAAAVILQTARGNLECIYPRKLVLASITNALIQRRFRDALLMVRRHRIDFNVIVDYCGLQTFIQSAADFVKQVNNFSHITEFVCAIKNENVTETLYKNFTSNSCMDDNKVGALRVSKDSYVENKVSSVLLAIRRAVEEHMMESPARELCILTTLARSDPPALEEALERIKVIREIELLNSDDPRRTSYPSSEEALKHLLWLSDADAVFDTALGLYDLKLAAIVAINSQRDPKEFIPYLQELEKMPFLLMCYNIDLRLSRSEKALNHIVSAGEDHFSDCMNLMKKQPQLFPLGLKLITDDAKKKLVLEAWGDYLSDEKSFEDAAETYLCCFNLEKALQSYRASGNWRQVFIVAGLLKMREDEILQLAHELCEELQALGKPGEAATIALEYCRDINRGMGLLISARDWEEALRIAFMHQREDLVSEMKNASVECASLLIGEYEEGLEKVGKYLTRYLAVRQRRLLLAAKIKAEESSMNNFDDDTASEASSNLSGMSAYSAGSRRSSTVSMSTTAGRKSREAKRQKSRGKIRPGSPGEEMALVEHLKGMSLTAGARSELKSLLVSLMMLGKEETAKKLQRTAENFQLSQMAAVNLANDTVSSDTINEQADTLENYVQALKSEVQKLEDFSWRSKVFLSS
ncbi:elongator complex protein 1 [Cucurbita moschata]|uniref:Elongator complex protein 1 n=1 Tax=Cucurbita moschata TaxID=3662 RepID=A0A6J1FJA3_CUCMO|nr:elongator complex protein 1 [Cucurbita moschata]XP_022938582.1 elongator complex protein 1 [Cucurbita moschata]XP_022938583.1 elongator complex protein 1 [Cucurbita moschata]